MRRLFLVLIPAAIVALFACDSFSEATAPEAPDASGDDASPDAASSVDASDASDGGCSARTANGEIERWTFDDGTCQGLQVFGGNGIGVSDPARCGAGSCKICGAGTGPGQGITVLREVAVARDGGTFEVDFAIRDESTAMAWAASLEILRDAQAQNSVNASGTMTKTEWTPGQMTVTNPSASSAVKIRIHGYPSDGGTGCFFVDEISFGHR